MQYKIPQNVGIEDKIVGPFSLRQLIILAGGAGVSYVLFVISSKLYELNIIEYILIALPALFALAAATLKIYNVSFTKYIFLMLEFAIKPKKRMWDHRGISALVSPDLSESVSKKKEEKETEKDRKNVNLGDLSAMLDSGGFEHIQKVEHSDIDKVSDDDLITEAYFGNKKEESPTKNMYWRTREVQKKKLDLLAKLKPTEKAPVKVEAIVTEKPEVSEQLPPPPKEAKSAPIVSPEALTHITTPEEVKTEIPPQPITEAVIISPAPVVVPEATVEKKPVPANIHLEEPVKLVKKDAPKTENKPVVFIDKVEKKEVRKENQKPQIKISGLSLSPKKQAPNHQQIPKPANTKPTSKPQPQINVQPQSPAPAPKKKRKRKRKPNPGTQPLRQDAQINSTSKSEPIKLIQTPAPPARQIKKEGETSFNDLSKGGEIEFNLD